MVGNRNCGMGIAEERRISSDDFDFDFDMVVEMTESGLIRAENCRWRRGRRGPNKEEERPLEQRRRRKKKKRCFHGD